MSYRLLYSENFHFSNFQHPASEAANKFVVLSLTSASSEYFQRLHFWNQLVPLIKMHCRVRYLFKIHSGQVWKAINKDSCLIKRNKTKYFLTKECLRWLCPITQWRNKNGFFQETWLGPLEVLVWLNVIGLIHHFLSVPTRLVPITYGVSKVI